MKYLFFSDRFKYIHPTLLSRRTKEYSSADLKIAVDNTSKIMFDNDLLERACRFSGYMVPTNQKGSLFVFPNSTGYDQNSDKDSRLNHHNNLLSFITKTFKASVEQLKHEYSNKSDPLEFYEIDDSGKYFNSFFENNRKNAKDFFSPESITIYIAGVKDLTATYLFEEFLDRCYTDAAKHDRLIIRNMEDRKNMLHFENFHTFLTYSFCTNDFCQIGEKDNEIFHEPIKRKTKNTSSIMEYAVFD